MNNFEYLQYVSVGQYLPTGSVIHRLDPRARILATVIFLVAITFSSHILGLLIALAVLIALTSAARISLPYILKSLLPPLPFLLILAVLQILFITPPGATGVLFHAGWIRISTASLVAGVVLLLRFAGLILVITLSSLCISTSEMIRGLESLLSPLARLGFPTEDLVMTVQVMLRFLPFLALSAERIAKAQASRGATWGTRSGGLLGKVRQVVPLLVPLFLFALRKSENLALAMEARGYGSQAKRSSMMEMHFLPRDAAAVLAAVVVSAAITIL